MAQVIKVQSDSVLYSRTTPADDLTFNVAGQLNVTKEVNVGNDPLANGEISTFGPSTDLKITTVSGNLKLQPIGSILLNNVAWPDGTVSPVPGMYLGVSALNTLQFYTLPSSGAITLTGDVTGAGSGSILTTLANTLVVPGLYTNANIVVDAKGRITSAVSGTSSSSYLTINTQASDYVLQLSDASNTLIRITKATLAIVTIPADITTNFPIGTAILIGWNGTGQVSIAGGAGVTIDTPETYSINKRYGKITAIKTGANHWEIEGNLAPVL